MTKLKYVLVGFLLSSFVMLSSGCNWIDIVGNWLTQEPEVQEPPAVPTPTQPAATPIDPAWQPPQCDGDKPPLPDFVDVVAKVKPSVVSIQTEVGAGSGWIIEEDGIIVTNNHVVAGAREIAILLDDGRTFPAQEVRTDPLTDLAVVTIDVQDLPAADIGDSSKLQLGEPVAVIGNALGEGISMTGGWVSQLEVTLPVSAGQTLDDLIRTDAAINPGNSGGPLVNMAGEVIGITSVKIAQVGVEGFGYAISINTAKDVIDQLIVRGYVLRTYLGVRLSDVSPVVAFFNNLSVDKGAMVTFVSPDSPADEAGLKEGDVIVGLDDEEIANGRELIEGIHSRQVGQEVKIVYWRGNTKYTVHATLVESPPPY